MGVHRLVDKLHTALFAGHRILQQVLFAAEGRQLPQGIAAGRFDGNDLGPGFAEQRGAKLVAQPPQADVQDPEFCQGLIFPVSFFESQVVLGPITELQRLPSFVNRFYLLVGRRRGDREGSDIHIHQTDGVSPAFYLDISLFWHILPPLVKPNSVFDPELSSGFTGTAMIPCNWRFSPPFQSKVGLNRRRGQNDLFAPTD